MYSYLTMLWSSTKANQEQATQLADGIRTLSEGKKEDIIVIKLTDNWWGIVGDSHGEKAYNSLKTFANQHG